MTTVYETVYPREGMERKRVLGVLAGEDMPLELLREWAQGAEVVLAADGGAERLRQIGIVPDVTIGDLDSISEAAAAGQRDLRHDADQDTTDCDKLLALAARLGHDEITLASVEGDLLDHVLGTLSSALRTPLRVRLALRRGVGWVMQSGDEVEVETAVGTRVSLVPLLPDTVADLEGVHWPLEGTVLSPTGLTSVSNRAEAESVTAKISAGAGLLFVEGVVKW